MSFIKELAYIERRILNDNVSGVLLSPKSTTSLPKIVKTDLHSSKVT